MPSRACPPPAPLTGGEILQHVGADNYLALAEQGAGQPNLRGSLAHSITTGDIESAWRPVAALHRFWDITGPRREAHEWIQRALAIGDPPATPAAVAGLAAASMILHLSDSRAHSA